MVYSYLLQSYTCLVTAIYNAVVYYSDLFPVFFFKHVILVIVMNETLRHNGIIVRNNKWHAHDSVLTALRHVRSMYKITERNVNIVNYSFLGNSPASEF